MEKIELLLNDILKMCEEREITIDELDALSKRITCAAKMSEIGCRNATKFRIEMNDIGNKINSDSERESRKLLCSRF